MDNFGPDPVPDFGVPPLVQQCLRAVLEEGVGVDQAPSSLRARVEGVRGMVGEYMVTGVNICHFRRVNHMGLFKLCCRPAALVNQVNTWF